MKKARPSAIPAAAHSFCAKRIDKRRILWYNNTVNAVGFSDGQRERIVIAAKKPEIYREGVRTFKQPRRFGAYRLLFALRELLLCLQRDAED